MSVVSIAEAWPSPGKPFTVADLDGALVVSPRPTPAHHAEPLRARQPLRCEVVPARLVAGLRPPG